MKKIEAGSRFLREHGELFQCPICQGAFGKLDGHSVVCANGHRFDVSKKGTLHLLMKGGQNEYDKDMLSSRKNLADTGFFHPLLDAVYAHIDDPGAATVLDVGCGEGSHLHYLTEKGLQGTKIGFDISKDAIQLAAGNFFADAFWCVADLAHSPFGGNVFDVILNIFSPSQYQEFDRVLKPGGKVIKVVPNAQYLIELREQLYALDTTKREYDNQQVVDRFYAVYPDASKEEIVYTVDLDDDSYGWLMEMTPLSWGASEAALANATANPLKSVTVAVTVLAAGKAV